ncbi:LuxR family transcriptional regulator [Pacificoceanicola onchidii]|uniref:LuxR family transcriptional regulator n=1 Tax=Pacificoceanicola onchidii TaxID=2562685 RepID=UPI0010A640DB|nr:LuxR family transcriptional regulator [Pacificoceanicola onchidii]
MQLRSDIILSGSVQESIALLTDFFEVEFFTLHLFRNGKEANNTPYVRTNYPDGWVAQYLMNDFVKIDPVLMHAEGTDDPFCWSEITLDLPQMQLMEKAIASGIGQTGFTVSYRDPVNRRSILSFNAQQAQGGDTWKPFLEENGEALQGLAEDLHMKALAEVFSEMEELPQLSPRESECLKWTAEGKAHTEIAIILGLSEHTVRSYLKVARIKLDSVSLAQAVAKASQMGLI